MLWTAGSFKYEANLPRLVMSLALQRHHLAGPLGTALADRLFAPDWDQPAPVSRPLTAQWLTLPLGHA